jgi:hypothetical protein
VEKNRLKKINTYRAYAYFVLFYVLVVMLMPANPLTVHSYKLSDLSYRVLILAVSAVPAFLVWFAAFYGYEQLRRYSESIAKSAEGRAWRELTRGVGWTAFALPVVSTLGIWLVAIANVNRNFIPSRIIISNYATVILAVISFTIIGNGARILAERAKTRPNLGYARYGMLAYLILVMFYSYFLFSHSLNLQRPNPYNLPVGLLLTTMVIPFAYAWFVGFLASLDVLAYAEKVTGILYRRALQLVAGGIITIICASILLQYINTSNINRSHLVLSWTLLVRYALYFALATGFWLIGNGAKKLQQIEKI